MSDTSKQTKIHEKVQMISYGMGDFAINGFNTIVQSFLLFFYTDVVRMNLDTAGQISVISRTVDALMCIAVGALIDRTTTKWGKARPFILLGGIPCGIFLMLAFWIPPVQGNALVWYLGITSITYAAFYALSNVAYNSMLGSMTTDSVQRLSYNRVKSVCSSLGAVLVTTIFLPLSRLIGGGELKNGILICVILIAAMNMGFLSNCFFNTREIVGEQAQKISVKEALLVSLKNKYWLILCLLGFLLLAGNGMRVQGTIYFAEYYLNSEAAGTVLLSINTFMPIPISLIVPSVAGRIGKKKMVLLGNIIMLGGLLLMGVSGKIYPLLILAQFILSLGWGFASGVIFVMIADVVDYTEKLTGKRAQGFQTSTVTLMMKMGIALTSLIAASILSYGGYQQGQVQSDAAIAAIRMMFIYLPMVIVAVTTVVTCFYNLDE